MIKLNDVSVEYNQNTILKELSYNFIEGNIYILNGENGSGKSTLLRSIAGLIRYNGKIDKKLKIGFLPDKASYPSLYNSYDYLKSIAKLNNTLDKLNKLIDLFSLDNKIIARLSKGNIQKIGIIQLLLANPDAYLLDEPFDGLDSQAKQCLKKYLLGLKEENKIIILSIHDNKIFSNSDAKYLEIKEGYVNEKKTKKPRAAKDIL